MTCQAFSTVTSLFDLAVWPTSCNYYFYLYIFEFLFTFFTWSTYKYSEEKIGLADILSSAAVSSLVIVFLASIGTLIKNSSNVPMVQSDILIILFAQFTVLLVIWKLKK